MFLHSGIHIDLLQDKVHLHFIITTLGFIIVTT